MLLGECTIDGNKETAMLYYVRSVLLVLVASLAIVAGTVVAAHAEKLTNIYS
jgi:hypothetical protein